MERIKINSRKGPESKIQDEIVAMLRMKGWFVIVTHGNQFQSGLPDLFATHSRYKQRWIEVKNPLAYNFTAAQLETFPKMSANGAPIWILCAGTEVEYQKLFKAANWYQFFYEKVLK